MWDLITIKLLVKELLELFEIVKWNHESNCLVICGCVNTKHSPIEIKRLLWQKNELGGIKQEFPFVGFNHNKTSSKGCLWFQSQLKLDIFRLKFYFSFIVLYYVKGSF